MNNQLTPKQKEVYLAIKNFISKTGYAPSIREIAKIINVNSPATVLSHLKKMKAKGYIDWQPKIYRTLIITKDL